MSETQASNPLGRSDVGDVTVLRVTLPMLREDDATEELFRKATSVVEDEGRARLVLNCAAIAFMASMALGRLIKLMHKANAAGGRLVLCNVPQAIEGLLRVSRLLDVLMNFRDEQEAVRNIG